MIDDTHEDLEQIAFEPWQNHLRFRIAETDVVFDNFRAVRSQHQSDVQNAGVIL